MSEQDRAARAVAEWRKEMPGMDVLAMEVIGRLNDLSAVIGRDHLEPHFAGFGLQRGEFDVLATLRRSGAPFTLTPTDLYEATMMTSGGMTARLDRLEKRGLIARQPNPDDRRGTLVSLTDQGRDLVEAAVVPHAANETRLLAVLTPDERDQLNGLLRKLRAELPDPA
ncbi:MarR family transcriptional regulator [Paracoccus sp. M683]|uniref:MarR family winged helix-turn-helix transcriptional regulator n=1 Tax=Paracoccus sp. M683 TaxID=2594268 RepID=UPI00117E3CBE|nr:MarR family transcriptional regulator [Paracoccus sp. M683]TRW98642.1 MarR family transcriptional regulator [Paracoccus sp. M683]